MFATKELVSLRKKEAKRLQSSLRIKLIKVQKLVIDRIIAGKEITLSFSSHGENVSIGSIGNIKCGNKHYEILLKPWPHMNFDYDNCICEFYAGQHKIIDHWIKILTK